jgi:hypothetical protein
LPARATWYVRGTPAELSPTATAWLRHGAGWRLGACDKFKTGE